MTARRDLPPDDALSSLTPEQIDQRAAECEAEAETARTAFNRDALQALAALYRTLAAERAAERDRQILPPILDEDVQSVTRREAMEIVELEPILRRQALSNLYGIYHALAIEKRRSRVQAEAFATMMQRLISDLVRTIEATGGSFGGRA